MAARVGGGRPGPPAASAPGPRGAWLGASGGAGRGRAEPCGLLDVAGYWAPLVALLDHAVREGFLRAEQRALLLVEAGPAALLDALAARAPRVRAPFDRRRS